MGCSERVGWFALQPGGSAVLPAIPRIFADIVHAPLLSVEPMSQVVGDSVAQQRFDVILLCDSAGSHSSLASPVSIELCLISWHGKRGRLASGWHLARSAVRSLAWYFGTRALCSASDWRRVSSCHWPVLAFWVVFSSELSRTPQ